MDKNIKKYKLTTNLTCAHCGSLIEAAIKDLPEVEDCTVSVLTKQIIVTTSQDFPPLLRKIQNIAQDIEPGTTVDISSENSPHYLYYMDLDCAHCATLIETALQKLPQVESLSFTLVTKQLRFTLKQKADLQEVLHIMRDIAHKIEPGTTITAKLKGQPQNQQSFLQKFHTKFHPLELILGASLFILLNFTNIIPEQWHTYGYLLAYLLLGIHVLKNALTNILKMRIVDESLLMTIATLGAFLINEHPEAVGVMLFYRLGQAFESYATNNSRKQIMAAVDMRPERVNLLQKDGSLKVIPAEDVNINDLIVVKPGERIPVDGLIVQGESRLDTSPITGEPTPVKATPQGEVYSGYINLLSPLTIKVSKDLANSMVSKILDAVENAAATKPKVQRLISRFAKVYTPIVMAIATCTAIIPPLFTGNWDYWIYTALTFLVISCPCALVLSVPLAFFSGLGVASRHGILFKGGLSMEALLKIKAVAFDKTGTLTKGVFTVKNIYPAPNFNEEQLLSLAASCEANSNHPIAESITKYAKEKQLPLYNLTNCQEIAGLGLKGIINNKEILCGNEKLLVSASIKLPTLAEVDDTLVYVAVDGQYAGLITIGDQIKDEAPATIKALQSKNLITAIFTGDNWATATKVGQSLGIDKVFAKLLPQDKLEQLLTLRTTLGGVLFVGDGINDAPILAGADVSAAMGSGADAAIEAADMVIINSNLQSLIKAFDIAKATINLAWQNVIFALGIKTLIMILGLLGYASMWLAVFADSGVTLLCVLNTLRLFAKKYV